MPKAQIVLKDMMFNEKKVTFLAERIKKVYSVFNIQDFIDEVLAKFPELELKQRIFHITDMLEKYLPSDYKTAVNIMLESLPSQLDPNKEDNDFGMFILSPYGEYVAKHGCCGEYLDFSLGSFEEFTKRFSMEFAIRPFLKKYPNETLKYVKKWSLDANYHVRRFASEGIRPNLPWGGKVDIGILNTLNILDNLHTDHTQYVLRSVANNLNDITKIDSDVVIHKLLEWKKEGKQTEKNILFLITHSLRTQIKAGNPDALVLLGYEKPEIHIENFIVTTPQVQLGENLEFHFDIVSNKSQKLLINYFIHFVTAHGKTSPKVFHIGKKQLLSGDIHKISKKHSLQLMTTKKLYTGKHFIEIFINGESFEKKSFDFVRGK